MEITAGRHQLGPETCSLRLRTRREGVAAKVGHDLVLAFGSWSGLVEVAGPLPASATVEVTIDTRSVEVVEASGGVAPLTVTDRRDIEKNARRLLDVDRHPAAAFRSTRIDVEGDSGTIEGQLTLRGTAVRVMLSVTRPDGGLRATGTVLQSAFGITPFKAFFGALRLADPVQIEVLVPSWDGSDA